MASIIAARNTPESRARSTETNNRRWSDPAKRAKLSEWNRKRWANPKIKKKVSKAIAKKHRSPEMRAFYSRLRFADWQRPEYREKMVAAVRASHGRPEYRAKFSELLRERWNDPEMRAKYITGSLAVRANPEYRAKLSQSMKHRWATDENFRTTVLEAFRLYQSSSEALEARSTRMKALWADPVWRMRQLSIIAANPNTPERIRKKLSISALNNSIDLMGEVESIVPRALPDFVRMDVCQDIMVALLEGDLQLSELRANWRGFLSAHRQMFPDKWGPISIDAPLPGTDGFTIADTLSNETPHF